MTDTRPPKIVPNQLSNDMPDQATCKSPNYPVDATSAPPSVTSDIAAPAYEAPFRFMDLSAELRNIIYRQCFDELANKKMQRSRNNNHFGHRNGCDWPENGCEYTSILHSSHQVRKEAAPILYREYVGDVHQKDQSYWIFRAYRVRRNDQEDSGHLRAAEDIQPKHESRSRVRNSPSQ